MGTGIFWRGVGGFFLVPMLRAGTSAKILVLACPQFMVQPECESFQLFVVRCPGLHPYVISSNSKAK
jgi:hypothetical protein